MENILLICVNYGSYDVMHQYLKSIDIATRSVTDMCKIEVAVVDNTPDNYQDVDLSSYVFSGRVFPFHINYGYMGGAVKALEEMGETYTKGFDYVIISNVDLVLSDSFFKDLLQISQDNIGWVVPAIYRINYNNANENPFLLNKPSKLKYNLLMLLYKYPILNGLYTKYFSTRKRVKYKNNRDTLDTFGGEIYAGLGSLFIFTRQFVKKNYPLTFPSFMYGEELFYGEMVRSMGLKTYYVPNIKAYDICGISTGKLTNSRLCKMNLDSMKIIKTYLYNKRK